MRRCFGAYKIEPCRTQVCCELVKRPLGLQKAQGTEIGAGRKAIEVLWPW